MNVHTVTYQWKLIKNYVLFKSKTQQKKTIWPCVFRCESQGFQFKHFTFFVGVRLRHSWHYFCFDNAPVLPQLNLVSMRTSGKCCDLAHIWFTHFSTKRSLDLIKLMKIFFYRIWFDELCVRVDLYAMDDIIKSQWIWLVGWVAG